MSKTERLRIVARGAVQGVGFRPFVYRLANEMHLNGWVSNSASGVFIEAEGELGALRSFLFRLQEQKPPCAIIQSLESSFLDLAGYKRFEIRVSEDRDEKSALILPDIATCADCLREIFDPADHRFRYPFTNCTNCGPRFSIIEAVPYDRANTSMKKFAMCAECEREYHDVRDRRFHAQPNACPRCGPQLALWDGNGTVLTVSDNALRAAAEAIRSGKILALKGIGGFQLIVDARDEEAVARLRRRKHREEKPFAVMFPSLQSLRVQCELSELEERLLLSPESPIVIVRKSEIRKRLSGSDQKSEIAPSIAPRNPNLGVMLPYSPLHHLLMRELHFPIVATSGNLSDEPICIDEQGALTRLRSVADYFLVHDRPILRHVDDSIARIMCGRELLLRRARGYAPLPVMLKKDVPPTLAVGAHLKNTVALGLGRNVFISQHIGDLATGEAYNAFLNAASDLPRLYEVNPAIIAHDLHPDYLSTKYANEAGHHQSHLRSDHLRLVGVQHHFAHIAACMAENEIAPPVLGVAWDGTGLGLDGTIWGGEFLIGQAGGFERVAHLRQFRLPGGDAAIKEPRRSALGLLYEIFGEELWQRHDLLPAFAESERTLLRQMLRKEVNAPLTSSAGRLFDAVAAIAGIRQRASFEGQAAMELEFAHREGVPVAYSVRLPDTSPAVIDWEPLVIELLDDLKRSEDVGIISAKFHNALAQTIVAVAHKTGQQKVVLSGGCFQNRYLTERSIECLREAGFEPYWHQRVPPNDGCISLGQIAIAAWNSDPAPV